MFNTPHTPGGANPWFRPAGPGEQRSSPTKQPPRAGSPEGIAQVLEELRRIWRPM